MNIDSNTVVSIEEATQDFNRVICVAEKYGRAVIFENSQPKYLVIDLEAMPRSDTTSMTAIAD